MSVLRQYLEHITDNGGTIASTTDIRAEHSRRETPTFAVQQRVTRTTISKELLMVAVRQRL